MLQELQHALNRNRTPSLLRAASAVFYKEYAFLGAVKVSEGRGKGVHAGVNWRALHTEQSTCHTEAQGLNCSAGSHVHAFNLESVTTWPVTGCLHTCIQEFLHSLHSLQHTLLGRGQSAAAPLTRTVASALCCCMPSCMFSELLQRSCA
eukprot:1157403-Pelagomonas_calceolata.AAC.2